MSTQTPISDAILTAGFAVGERRALRLLRARYHRDHDLFTPAEMARLRFTRWLARSGRLAS